MHPRLVVDSTKLSRERVLSMHLQLTSGKTAVLASTDYGGSCALPRSVYPTNNHGAIPPFSRLRPPFCYPPRKQYVDILYTIFCVFSVNFGSWQSG